MPRGRERVGVAGELEVERLVGEPLRDEHDRVGLDVERRAAVRVAQAHGAGQDLLGASPR